MIQKLVLALILLPTFVFSQEILKENLSKKVHLYYDYNKINTQASGYYFKDELGETTEKHGHWKYFDRMGVLEEERDYYRDALYGMVKVYYPNKKIKSEGYFKFNNQDSVYREYYENGNLTVQGYYQMGKPVGKWEYYYRDGRLKSVEEVLDNTNYLNAFYLPDSLHTQILKDGNGELRTFFTTGSLKEVYTYKNGLKNGSFEEYSPYGYLMLTGSFIDGKKDGQWQYAYYTGQLEKVSNYKNDILNGDYKYYYDNGKTNVEGKYKNGKKSGKWTWYNNRGQKDQEGFFSEDLQDGKWTYYYPTGELSYNAEYKLGKAHGFWSYFYKDGSRFKEGSFSEDLKDGDWKTWYENGNLLMSGKYVKGKEEGEWKNYWENGNLKNKSTFKDGLLSGTWESYHQSGRPSLKGNYKENNKTGEWTSFYDNGLPKEIITYKVFTTKSLMDYSVMKNFERTDSERNGKYYSFSQKDFKLVEEGSYSRGEKDGEWIAYHPGGKMPAVISNFKKGQLHGVQKQFDRRGLIVSEIDYKDGLRDGKALFYDKKGNVVKEMKYKNGLQVIEGTATGSGFGL